MCVCCAVSCPAMPSLSCLRLSSPSLSYHLLPSLSISFHLLPSPSISLHPHPEMRPHAPTRVDKWCPHEHRQAPASTDTRSRALTRERRQVRTSILPCSCIAAVYAQNAAISGCVWRRWSAQTLVVAHTLPVCGGTCGCGCVCGRRIWRRGKGNGGGVVVGLCMFVVLHHACAMRRYSALLVL
jgi:hypothetical protein